MINFDCPHCGKPLSISEEKAGKKKKCPQCRSMVRVPEDNSDTLIFDEENFNSIKNEKLKSLYETFVKGLGDGIVQQQFNLNPQGLDEVEFLVLAGDNLTRTQSVKVGVLIFPFQDHEIEHIYVLSSGGVLYDQNKSLDILLEAREHLGIRVSAHENEDSGYSIIVDTLHSLASMDSFEFAKAIVSVAMCADKIEEITSE